MNHICHAEGCSLPVNPKLLMCSRHWTMVPTELQVKVRNHFHPDQCKGKRRPSLEWITAAREAINYVREREKGWAE
jgi:hypothetical protein